MIEMFVRVVYFRKATREIARARVMTMKNQVRMTVFHLYFISMNIRANARAKVKIIERRVGVGSSSGVSNPNGRSFEVVLISPVIGSTVDIGA